MVLVCEIYANPLVTVAESRAAHLTVCRRRCVDRSKQNVGVCLAVRPLNPFNNSETIELTLKHFRVHPRPQSPDPQTIRRVCFAVANFTLVHANVATGHVTLCTVSHIDIEVLNKSISVAFARHWWALDVDFLNSAISIENAAQVFLTNAHIKVSNEERPSGMLVILWRHVMQVVRELVVVVLRVSLISSFIVVARLTLVIVLIRLLVVIFPVRCPIRAFIVVIFFVIIAISIRATVLVSWICWLYTHLAIKQHKVFSSILCLTSLIVVTKIYECYSVVGIIDHFNSEITEFFELFRNAVF